MSSAAKREDIQKRLQDLRTQKQKEKEAFDQLVAENADLSPEEMAALARQQGEKATIETSMIVDGATVSVGDSVRVVDDAQALVRAERGLLPPDAIKRVYLGETGTVVRVWSAFQGKPAVELRFADTCTKIFFGECIELDHPSAAAASSSVAPRAAAGAAAATANGAARPPKGSAAAPTSPTEVATVPPPSWAALSLPGKGKPAAKAPTTAPTTAPATAPATAAPVAPEAEPSPTTSATGAATPIAPVAPVASVAEAAPPAMASVGITKSRPPPAPTSAAASAAASAARPPAQTQPAAGVTTPAPAPSGPLPAYPPVAPPPSAPSHPTPEAVEGLGKPTEDLVLEARRTSTDAAGAAEMDDLLRTPRPDFLAASTRSGGAPRMVSPPASPLPALVTPHDTSSAIPRQCPSNYQPKFPLHDPASGIPRCAPADMDTPPAVGARTGDVPRRRASPRVGSSGALTPKREAPRPITPARALGSRHPTTTTTAGARPTSTLRSGVMRPTGALAAGRPSSASRPVVSVTRPAGAPAPTRAPLAAALAGARKPIQVRVFENGIYDNDAYDRVYRTITIRPTYKTIASLKSMVGRELLWRDGRKVETLFDASGAEITDLAEIQEGQSLIASGGDRFVIPFPNSILHAEALKLSHQQ